MCEVNWVLLSGFIAAVASATNAGLLVWMILVTRRYVDANIAILDVNRGTLEELRKQYEGHLAREIRPYRSLLERSIRNLESIKTRDLVFSFGHRDGSGWLSPDELLPSDYDTFVLQSMSFDAELHSSLDLVRSTMRLRPTEILREMERLARSGRSTLPELPKLQAEFRAALDPSLALLKSTQANLLAHGSTASALL